MSEQISNLDERKIKLVELRLQGKNKSAIAREIGISRQTVYEWLQDHEVIRLVQEGQQDLIQSGRNKLANKLDDYIDILDKLARTSNDKRTQATCAMYLTDRILGKVASTLEGNIDEDVINDDILDKEFEEVDQEQDPGLKIIK